MVHYCIHHNAGEADGLRQKLNVQLWAVRLKIYHLLYSRKMVPKQGNNQQTTHYKTRLHRI